MLQYLGATGEKMNNLPYVNALMYATQNPRAGLGMLTIRSVLQLVEDVGFTDVCCGYGPMPESEPDSYYLSFLSLYSAILC